jgi:hypothetical protein
MTLSPSSDNDLKYTHGVTLIFTVGIRWLFKAIQMCHGRGKATHSYIHPAVRIEERNSVK